MLRKNAVDTYVGTTHSFDLENLEARQLLSGDVATIELNVGATPESVIFADFNGDEINDTAVLAPDLGQIQIWTPDEHGDITQWAVIEGEFGDAHRLQVLDVDADGQVDIGFFDAATHRFTVYANEGDGSFSFAGGLQLADTATGFVLLYASEGPAAEPVGPWIGSEDFGFSRDGFGEGGDFGSGSDGSGDGSGSGSDGSGGGSGSGSDGSGDGSGSGSDGSGDGSGSGSDGSGDGSGSGSDGSGDGSGSGSDGSGDGSGSGSDGSGDGSGSGSDGSGDGSGSGSDGSGDGSGSGGDGSGGGTGSFPHFVGAPFIAVWHESLGAIELTDPISLLGDSMFGDGSGSGDSEDAIAWPFNGAYVDLPSGIFFETGSGGDAIAVKDFSNDGTPDIAVTNRNDGTVSVISFNAELEGYLTNGYDFATDGLIPTTTIDVGNEPVHINAFDVDMDGYMDMIVSNAGDGTFTIVHGSADGLGNPETVDVAPQVTQAFLNFNALGNDLFVLGFSADGTVTHLDFTDGSLIVTDSQANYFMANDNVLPRQTIVGEFTGDGFTDVAVIDQANGQVVIYSNIADQANDGEDSSYAGPPIDLRDVPIPGVPDLTADTDTGESDSDNTTAYNNAGDFKLKFDVQVSHVADELASLRTTLVNYFEANGPQYDKDGFEYTPSIWVNIYAGSVWIGSAEVGADDSVVTVTTDGKTVLREGDHQIRASFAIGAKGLRGLIGTKSAELKIKVELPTIDFEPPEDDGETVVVKKDDSGKPVIVIDPGTSNGDVEEVHLADFSDLPEITGGVVTVKEPKAHAKASRYAAAPSDKGLVLLERDDSGNWDGRNLTDEIPDSEPITNSNLEVLTTPWGNVNMAGLNDQGELVFYWQDGSVDSTGDANWNFVNLADDQLRDNGQAVPKFASSLTSFVTPWGAMNVAGLDANGHLRVIWWAPGLDNWVSSDLTEILGSTPLAGDISAWVTPWGGINITGLNTDGEMVAVWWAPGGEWTVTPLGRDLGAPALVSGSLTAFVSDTGKTFIAGITVDNTVGVFTWAPGDASWEFVAIDNLPEGTTLVGSVSGYYTPESDTVTLLAGSLDGNTYQLDGNGSDIGQLWTVGLFTV